MGHTAAILSFMVQDSPVPIVVVGCQRSSATARPRTRRSTCSPRRAQRRPTGDIAEVLDLRCSARPPTAYGLLHRGTRVPQDALVSYRSTFRTHRRHPASRP
ncbi:MAG: asparaginase domain-containing protein [Thermoanaerobaculaceae bacterium]